MDIQLFSTIQDDVASRLESDLGPSGLKVERSETDDEIVLADWAADHLRAIGNYPHAFVWIGSLSLRGADTTRRQLQATLPGQVFVMVRDGSSQNQERQKRLADKWTLAVVASLSGSRFGDSNFTNKGLLQNLSVNPITNSEDAAMWSVEFDLDLSIDLDIVLNNV